ncbi:hypothetical protein HanXRQr2_Chr10g0421961 [Helianthus annuus]|uniref:Uncharacterized protein n=1 Tax=Helianthus annuus TaxID=4232 RepID=A0A9K3HV35_HELAN|nr:hypothetical protein HanXRQr2_Chr10g0421961 [Helianthus annuus]
MDMSLTSNDMNPETMTGHCSVTTRGASWKSFVRKVVPSMICEEWSCLIGWYGEKVFRLDLRNDAALLEPLFRFRFLGRIARAGFCVSASFSNAHAFSPLTKPLT